MILWNYHTHTTFCDGKNTAEEMVQATLALGFETLGFSGHVDISPTMDIPAYQTEIRRLAEKYRGRIEILCGGEFDLCYPDPNLPGFDYRIGSNHFVDAGEGTPSAIDWSPEKFQQLVQKGFGGDVYRLTRQYFERVASLPDRIPCDFIGHFDLVTKFNDTLHLIDETDPRYLDPAMAALDALLEREIPFEINTARVSVGRMYPNRVFLERIHQRGGEILINSDAHRAEDLNRGFPEAEHLARSCGFDHILRLTKKGGKLAFLHVGL